MGQHSVADAKNNLSDLIKQAEQGTEVIITRHGTPVAVLTAYAERQPRPMTPAELDWLFSRQVRRRAVPGVTPEDSVALVRRMRDGDDW